MEVITLSSDEENESKNPAKKRIKLQSVPCKTICIDSSEEEEEKSLVQHKIETTSSKIINVNETKTPVVDDEHKNVDKSEADVSSETVPLTEVDPIEAKLSNFLDKCTNAITLPHVKERFSDVLPKVIGHYQKLKRLNCNLKDFECMVDRDKSVTYDDRMAAVKFSEMFNFLKAKLNEVETDVLLTGPKRLHLKKLEKALILIRHKIRKLDEAEVDFDDEENSKYMQAAKYKERAKKIYEKMCQIRGEDPNSNQPMYAKLNFDKSRYPDFNRAINKKYRNTLEFPTYFDLDNCLRKCVQTKNLKIHEDELKAEIKFCFEKLGNSMKSTRRLYLYDLHSDYIKDTEDPALKNEEINNKLKKHYDESKTKLEQIYEKYARMQESGVNPEVSSDSDDSTTNESD